jgi:hypothetical protein
VLVVGRLLDERVEHRDGALGPLEREALVSDVLRVQETLERLGGSDAVEDVDLLFLRKLVLWPLDALLDPLFLLGFGDVHVLDADRSAVRITQGVDDGA